MRQELDFKAAAALSVGVIVVTAFAVSAVFNNVVSDQAGNRDRDLWRGPGDALKTMTFEDDDEEMNAAMRQARETVGTFLEALRSPRESQSNFAIKADFQDDYGREYMWLVDVEYHDGNFHGTVGNTPNSVRLVGHGDRVTVARDRIADWVFIDDGLLTGGYTMRVMQDRRSPEEREFMDANINFRFE